MRYIKESDEIDFVEAPRKVRDAAEELYDNFSTKAIKDFIKGKYDKDALDLFRKYQLNNDEIDKALVIALNWALEDNRKDSRFPEGKSFIQKHGTFKYVDNEGNVWEEIEFDGFPTYIKKIDSTHFAMVTDTMNKGFEKTIQSSRPAVWHVRQFVHQPEFYSDLLKWLHDDEMIGGKSFTENKEKTQERKFDLGAGHLGNGITVWNRAREVHGDYEKIAHIDSNRKVSWYIDNPPREVVDYVQAIVDGNNPSVSTSQPYKKVFRNSKKEKNVIEITEEVKIGNTILEKGDKIKIIEKTDTIPNWGDYVVLRKVADSKGRVDTMMIGDEVQGTVDDIAKTSSGLRIKLVMDGRPNYGVFFVPDNYRIVYVNGERYEGIYD